MTRLLNICLMANSLHNLYLRGHSQCLEKKSSTPREKKVFSHKSFHICREKKCKLFLLLCPSQFMCEYTKQSRSADSELQGQIGLSV